MMLNSVQSLSRFILELLEQFVHDSRKYAIHTLSALQSPRKTLGTINCVVGRIPPSRSDTATVLSQFMA